MSWLLIGVAVWAAVALLLALLLGRSIRLADGLSGEPVRSPVPDFVPAAWSVPSSGSRPSPSVG
jgi:hypothetical protein